MERFSLFPVEKRGMMLTSKIEEAARDRCMYEDVSFSGVR